MKKSYIVGLAFLFTLLFSSCRVSRGWDHVEGYSSMPKSFSEADTTNNFGRLGYREFFRDSILTGLIDTAIAANLDLQGALARVQQEKAMFAAAHGAIFPVVNVAGSLGQQRFGKYTMDGVGNYDTNFSPNIEEAQKMPRDLPDYYLGLQTSWEADIWGRLRQKKKSALASYLGSVEGRNLVVTNLVAEIARNYYTLLGLDNQLRVLRETLEIQEQASAIIRIQKEAGVANELAVKQFEAQVLNSKGLEVETIQAIVETESRINLLLGRGPQPINRTTAGYKKIQVDSVLKVGVPAQLLENRPDLRRARFEVLSAKADLAAAKAAFYPSLSIRADLGLQSFNPAFFLNPASLTYAVFGGLVAPVVNRSAIRSQFSYANARQQESLYRYYNVMLTSYVEVYNEISRLKNLSKQYALKDEQVKILTESVEISSQLFRTGRASYFEVLITQQNMLQGRLHLISQKQQQLNAWVDLYKALGGGWRQASMVER